MKAADLDAVTIDAHGTLIRLVDPVPALQRLAPGHTPEEVERAFRAEVEYYVPRSLHGRDAASLQELRRDCTAVFNEALGAAVEPEDFAVVFEYELMPGAAEALLRLRALGLSVAVVANWDMTLPDRIEHLHLPVVTSAEAGVAKPDPAIFRLALERLGVSAGRALHIGDSAADEDGAAGAGMHFLPAPLAEAVWHVV